MFAYIFLAILAMVTARPSFIAVPADQIAFVDLNSLRRIPRETQIAQTPAPPQPRVYEQEQYEPIPVIQKRQHYFPTQHLQQQQQQQQQQQELAKTLITLPPIQDTTIQTQRVVTLQQQPQTTTQVLRQKPAPRYERPPDFGEYIDFGAHTGEAGAFGWYADYPLEASNRDESGSY